ncbi:3'-5' exoribonuclease YhaM [Listeria floridensis FSL S10-1187]|uniref:3'-5' exoribonuclease YhaM n=1 Tax=Listeria floridensis FSL S10-1187 TaxID=1265817 RepID=A0ABN0RI46_9LIST|nr:3'-5' exoribonuclease YhaM [Listeria floridensis]EUJ33602.1 3'-5' exoribonuclease YhaM [Listeria floridensis FSL S10-1187]
MDKKLLLHDVGESVDLFLLIKSSTKGIASNGKPFLTLMLQDKSGEIEAKLWDVSETDETAYAAEQIVHIAGEIQNYRGRKQLKIRQIRLATPLDNVSASEFMETAPVDKDEMSDEITQYIFEMKNANLQRITRSLIKKYQDAFFEYPAAVRHHHEFVSGLSFHVVSMLRLAKSISDLYPHVNRDLLYAGVILHDLGKVIELSGPVSTTYTLEGNLIGHISIVVEEVSKMADELGIDGEEVVVLKHVLLAHHGKGEWGSPKPPLVREAEILHQIDLMDATMNMMDKALRHTKPGEFTERVFGLDNRSFYRPSFDEM